MDEQDPVCIGCHRSIEEGSVVAFGEGLWHLSPFRCAKCKGRVECDSNLLLLSDGSPICEQCSYSCSSCRRPILDEAIMTGDEAYHADCFRCTQCDSKIDDLVFAKTSQGIYCMKCHQERKEAKRLREERERMERAEKMMEKLLPTIPEAEVRTTTITVEIVKGSDRSSYRLSISRASARLSMSSPTSSDKSGVEDEAKTLEALTLVRELRLEVAKHNPTSPLLYGTPQLHFGLLKEKVDKLTQKHAELEKSIRDMYIEKDLLGMDLEAMNEELALKPRPVTHNFRLSTSHDLMKQSYQVEVKALQDQKELLQQEIQAFVETRDRVLDEMQILSVRNAELSTINNDMMRELQGRKDAKAAPAAPSSSFNLTSFTGKMRRQRQMSGGNQQELKAQNLVAGSNESTLSFVSTNSDGASSRSQQGSKSKKEDRQEDIFGEEIVAPKKFNWKKGTINTMNTSDASAANGRGAPTMLSDNGSSNGQILPPTRSFSGGSDSRSLNGQYTEQHFFIQHNYIKPTRCDCCDDKMWGREYKCRGCGFQIHGRCTHEIVPGCSGRFKDSDSSSIRNLTPSVMFGNSLLDQLEIEQRAVPMVVEKCIEAVDERGLEVEGIYRRSGMAVEARQLVQAFDSGLYPNLMDTAVYQDICSITSVLKQYLRTLPEPLIPYDLYSEFMEATGLPHTDDKYDIFKELMDRMPFAHYQTLKVLMEHLNRVTDQESINLMTSKNLSVVFGPTLMRNPDPSREILDMTSKNLTIEFLIVNTSELFV
ncbi:hypothetical protein BKA57DRAFT_394691, partial [Linnemannia elongata]